MNTKKRPPKRSINFDVIFGGINSDILQQMKSWAFPAVIFYVNDQTTSTHLATVTL